MEVNNNDVPRTKRFKKRNALLSIFLLGGLLALWLLVLAPRITQLESDFDLDIELVSVDNFYDEARGGFGGEQYTQGRITYETLGMTDGVQTIKKEFTIAIDGEVLVGIDHVYGVNRITGAHNALYGDVPRTGYLFAPKNLSQGESFTYWHVNYNGPAQMEYVRETIMGDIHVYEYKSTYDGVEIDQTKDLDHLPEVGETRGIRLEPTLTLWVEPITGQLVSFQDETIAYYYNLETGETIAPWNKFSNTVTQSSVEVLAQRALWMRYLAMFSGIVVPILFVLIAMAVFIRFFVVEEQQKQLLIPMGYMLTSALCAVLLIGSFVGIEELLAQRDIYSWINPWTAGMLLILALVPLLEKTAIRKVIDLFLVFLLLISGTKLAQVIGVVGFQIDQIGLSQGFAEMGIRADISAFTLASVLMLTLLQLIKRHMKQDVIWPLHIFSGVIVSLSIVALGAHITLGELVNNLEFLESASIPTISIVLVLGLLGYANSNDETKLSHRSWMTLIGAMTIVLLFIVGFISLVEWNFKTEAEGIFETQVTEAVERIEERAGTYIIALEGGRGLLRASEFVDRTEWQAYASALELDVNYPGIQGYGYAVFVPAEQREEHEALIQAEGFPEYKIKPEGDRDPYTAIVYLEPFDERNRQAFGFDMYSEGTRRAAMNAAILSGDAQMSGKITLVQEIDEDVQPGFLIYVPYYGLETETELTGDPMERIVGFVYAPFRARNFFEGIIGLTGISGIAMEVYDGSIMDPEYQLYSDYGDKVGEGPPRFSQVITTTIAGRPWIFRFSSEEHYGREINELYWLAGIALMGLLLGMLFIFAFYSNLSSEQKALRYADKQTAQLKQTEEQLKKQVEDMERTNKLMVNRERRIRELKKNIK